MKPCKNGSIGLRVDGRCKCAACVDEVRLKDRRRYQVNRESKLVYAKRYFAENKDVVLAQNKAWRKKHADVLKAKDRAWYHSNKDADNARRKKAYESNKPATRLRMQKWYVENKDSVLSKNTQRNIERSKRLVGWQQDLNDLVFAECVDLVGMRNKITTLEWEVDHMLPLLAKNVSGLHVWNNLQVIPKTLNRAKRNGLVLCSQGEWLQKL